jgi:hypothetical protein
MQRVFYQATCGLDIPGCTSCGMPRKKVVVIAADSTPGSAWNPAFFGNDRAHRCAARCRVGRLGLQFFARHPSRAGPCGALEQVNVWVCPGMVRSALTRLAELYRRQS